MPILRLEGAKLPVVEGLGNAPVQDALPAPEASDAPLGDRAAADRLTALTVGRVVGSAGERFNGFALV
jgi:hypothetical protein